MRHINLLPKGASSAGFQGLKKGSEEILLAAGVALALLTAAHAGYWQWKIQGQKEKVTEARGQLEELTHGLEPLKANAAREQEAEKRVTGLKEILARKVGWSDKFREFSRALPKGVWLTGMSSIKADGKIRFVLRGESDSNRKIASFVDHLEQIPLAHGVTLNYSERVPDQDQDLDLYRFEMSVPLAGLTGKGP